jgi:hypothetical protein
MRGHAALKSVPFLGSLRELDPICRKPKPGLFVEVADRLLRLLGRHDHPFGFDLSRRSPASSPISTSRRIASESVGTSG